jgi:ionotropic glutamate receptor
MKRDVVAVVGPQSSVLTRVVSNMANELQIPLLSFAATDPTLSSYQYPYFFRMAHDDSSQMTAIAALISHYNWRKVVAVYIDDDYGRNGMSVLDDELRNVGARIVYKAVLPPEVSRSDIGSHLVQLAQMESRILVVHMNPDAGLKLFAEARYLKMLSTGYVWIATDWLSSAIDSDVLDSDTMSSLQGVIGLRLHTPLSDQLRAFTLRWNILVKARSVETHLNVFGLYAYDTVWAIAQAIDMFLSKGGNITFGSYTQLFNTSGKKSERARLKVFREGPKLLQVLLRTNFTGRIGPVQLGQNGDLLNSTFEIINIAGTGFRKVSYWSSQSGLSVSPPESNQSRSGPQLHEVIWPGESKSVPRGWILPNDGRQLVIGVPRKAGFRVFVTSINGANMMSGFCIDVFTAAVNLLPYAVPFIFNSFVNGNSTPNYDQLVEQVALKLGTLQL